MSEGFLQKMNTVLAVEPLLFLVSIEPNGGTLA